MKLGKTFYTADRKVWRKWLEKHHAVEKEIWLVYPKKDSKRPRLLYNDAVEEALCFGWIDSTVRGIDDNSYAQRFSPRRPRSKYSEANKERLRKLIKLGKVIPEVVANLKGDLEEKFVVPPDILKKLRADPPAWKYFQKFSPAYKRIRVAFIEGARTRPREFAKRLRYFIRMTRNNRQFGFGGIKKYY
jgi:uncharacterized protein YdeI (YjbR/CyaY-like superfamily)